MRNKQVHKNEDFESISHELFTIKVYKKLNCPKDKLKYDGKNSIYYLNIKFRQSNISTSPHCKVKLCIVPRICCFK